jgi:CheY-like chemotaxis protein
MQRVRAERPAVMLLDILLGDMSGWDVLTILRADPMHADLPVILCTVTDPDHRTASLGVIEHLTKPIDRDHLATLVRRFVGTDDAATVMVVDDDDDYREQLATVLRRHGHRVRMASSGHLALQQMRQEPPDLVLLDLVMPGMDGLGVIDRMQQSPALAGVQVVLVTAADVGAETLRQLNERAVTLMHKDQVDLEQIARKAYELVDRVERSADAQPGEADAWPGETG